jgi:hypothetical protein
MTGHAPSLSTCAYSLDGAADLFAAAFAPGTSGWRKGFSQDAATRHFLEVDGVENVDLTHVTNALVAEAFQLLERRGLICLFLADGSSTVHVRWYVTCAGRAAAHAGDVRAMLEGL